MSRDIRQARDLVMEIEKREDDGTGDLFLEGYFAIFNSSYELWPGFTESIAPGAFTGCISGDVRALYNHDTNLVLGRTGAGTLELREDSHGLWGKIKINRNDTDAMNAYTRIMRGDVTQCSFGFDIESEEFRDNGDGTCHWTILKVNPLYEISPCVFPAYKETTVSARKEDFDNIQKRQHEAWQNKMKSKIKGG
ncbi:HK97 family phage prohead protease [Acetobacterium sp.]|uniref:HK97 family phage prohead protease n=1 Tax=Acetobacterium sp. TaxID=1872094 RepID=UPI00271C486E|nr:HK97 family phage prohead protease [Acetobacterium sp.]MDO9492660.1 HK97 family phage prohead protease [Acetobacterium sp.]